ncbi:MAG TPA: tetratricopeptide repeat protein [Thermoplasmata archaeon]|nr:tetratricopeptide repeat protein [Thermoplasmata archaeon]
MEFAKLADGLVAAGFPNAAGDRLLTAAKDFPGEVVEAFTFGAGESLVVLIEGTVVVSGDTRQEFEYLAFCRGEKSKASVAGAEGEATIPALELAECRVIYSQPAQREVSPQYAIGLQRMELEVMRRLASEGFLILLSETGALPPGVPDDWLDAGFRDDFVSRLGEANSALLDSPEDATLHEEKGALQLARGRYREAVASFAAALRLDAGAAGAWRGLGDALLRMGRREAAEAFARARVQLPGAGSDGPLLDLAAEIAPPPVREVACGKCQTGRVRWLDLDLYRCLTCGSCGGPA